MGRTGFSVEKISKEQNLETKEGGTLIHACDTFSLPNTHYYKIQEDIMNNE